MRYWRVGKLGHTKLPCRSAPDHFGCRAPDSFRHCCVGVRSIGLGGCAVWMWTSAMAQQSRAMLPATALGGDVARQPASAGAAQNRMQ